MSKSFIYMMFVVKAGKDSRVIVEKTSYSYSHSTDYKLLSDFLSTNKPSILEHSITSFEGFICLQI